MSIYIPSPEIKQILNNTLSLINVTYKYKITALESIAHQVRYNFLNDKKTLIIIPDTESRLLLLDLLHEIHLDSIILSINLDDAPSRFAFGSSNNHTFISDCQSTQWETPSNRLKRVHDLLISTISNKYRTAYSYKSWRAMVDEYCTLQVSTEVLLLNRLLDITSLKIDQEALQDILKSVGEALMYYHPEFEIKDYSLLNHELNKNIAEHSKLKSTIDVMSHLLDVSEKLKKDYLKYGQVLENNFLSKKLSSINNLKVSNEKFKIMIPQWISQQNQLGKSILSGFLSEKQKNHTQKGKTLLKDLALFFADVMELTHTPYPAPNKLTINIVQTLSEIDALLNHSGASLTNLKHEYLKSVNIHNHLDPTLDKLESNLKLLIDEINNAGFLNDKLEINTLSFAKQTDIIIGLSRKLHLLLSEAEHNMYYLEWKQFLRQKSERDQKILFALRKIEPEKWNDTIIGWYLYHMITKDYIHLQKITPENINDLHDLFILNEDYNTTCKVVSHSANSEENIKKLRKTERDLYDFFTSEKGNSRYTTWSELLDNHYDHMEQIFPIVITDHDSLLKLKHSDNRNLIVLNDKESNLNIMQLFSNITYYWDENHLMQKVDFDLNLSAESSDFRQLKPIELLPLFRNLAENILTVGISPEIYMLKDVCIFSFASVYVNNKLLDILYNHGIKKILPVPNHIKALTGAFLEASHNIICIIEDALPDPNNTENVLWQSYILNIIQKNGIQILNIDSTDLFNDEISIDELINSIIPHNQYYS